MLIDALASLAGLIIPPAFDFIKKKFIKSNADTPQATLSSLATTKPEVMPLYIEAQSKLVDSEVRYYNRDVTQQVHTWVADLRAVIRPVFTIVSIALMFLSTMYDWEIDQSIQALMEITIASWFGSRLSQ